MFDFGNANKSQREAIAASDGPVLITAGPGTGKTYTLVQRALYLIEERGVRPESILIATFTEKAAKELITRISNELAARRIAANINEMYVGTFHAICLRILKECLERTRLRGNFRILDAFDQQYTVYQNIGLFREIEGSELVLKVSYAWSQAEKICAYVNNLSEELVSAQELVSDSDPAVVAIGRILETYKALLADQNLMDFSSIQTEAYQLLKNNPDVLEDLRSRITHIMVDEYQDTNHIQERLAFLLAGKRKNICVVGDDDQGLYRFRGATIRNILEFPQKFAAGECRIIPLVTNYRSDSDIIDFYNKWMSTTSGTGFRFDWGRFRYPKTIEPHRESSVRSPCTLSLSSGNSEEEWREGVLRFIKRLTASGKLKDLNQIAFLFRSVKNPKVTALARFLEENGVNVYSPRSDMFFERPEIRLALGCLLLLFPRYVEDLENGEHIYLQLSTINYYRDCIGFANGHLSKPENSELLNWIRKAGRAHLDLDGTTNYAYCALLYRLFAFKPFVGILDTDMDAGVVDIRPARNLAKLSQIIGKFEFLHDVKVLTGKVRNGKRNIDRNTELLFNTYLQLLRNGGIAEYEDDSEYAPSGCVSFLTIHQSKGMEFPIVLVDSLASVPRRQGNEIMSMIEVRYFERPAFEPQEETKFFDFWRLYYTAFSRAQDLLVLTCDRNSRTPSKYFAGLYSKLKPVESPAFRIDEFEFKPIKDVNLKRVYSFTSNISVYETCPLQYKFYKELGFMPIRNNAMLFGTLVHETIEDVHRAALRNEEYTITPENVNKWFISNYASLSRSERSYLALRQQESALRHVLRYVDSQHGDWKAIQEAEVELSLVKPAYILKGRVDLIEGAGNTVEIVDFKTERKPDLAKMGEKLRRCLHQLQIYAHLVEEKTGKKVSKLRLYYTGEESGVPSISFPYAKDEVDSTMAAFDDTVQRIIRKDFKRRAENPKLCGSCDFRFYCRSK